MKKIFSLAIISLITLSAFATDYTYGDNNNTLSAVLPLTTSSSTYTSISQQLFLASDLTGIEAGAGDITALTFYYGGKSNNTAVRAVSRTIEIYISAVSSSFTEFQINSTNHRFKFVDPGTKVYDGAFTTEAISAGEVKTKKINLSNSFAWDGTKNIVITMFDKTNTKFYSTSDYSDVNLRFALIQVEPARFVHIHQMTESSDEFSTYKSSLANKEGETYSTPNTDDGQRTSHHWVNRITFSISTTIPAPTNLAASSITSSSATLSWDAAAGATGYNVRWGKTSGSLDHSQSNVAATSLAISDLDDGETYYFDVQTITAGGTSAYASEANFTTTTVAHIHDGITFSKWASTTSMPTSGNYYLANDVTYDFYEGGYLNLAGDLNLCLNGHTINLGTKSINVTNGHTMTLFDHVGGGKITGLVAGLDGSLTFQGVISVENGGTLVLREGEVENTKPADDPEYKSIAIANGGTLIISGAPVISGNDMDIFLPPTIPAKVITIQSGKPLTNTTPYKVYKSDGVITSGWANMSGADPADYFVSANPNKSINYNGSEAELISILNLSDNADNSSQISGNNGQVRYVTTNRSFTAGMYNTICMPFALSSAQIESVFGAGTDVQELSSSTYDGEYIDMYFSPVSAMAANTPYLINPANNVANAAFNGVTIVDATPATVSTSFVDLTGITSITALTASEDRYLLGANNKLGYLEANGNLKGMRAYFDTHNLGGGAAPAKRLRIAPDQSMPSALDEATTDKQVRKHMENGQLIIIRDGKRYNALGAEL